MKKILITYVTYGSGHKTIAQYIYDHLTAKGYIVKMVDILDYTGKVTNATVKAFDFVYNHRLEKTFSFLYGLTDHEAFNKYYKFFLKKGVYNNRIKKIYADFNPDVVISTHFYGSNITAILNKHKVIKSKIVTVVTDYKVHKMWMTSYDKNENFVVANDIVKSEMQKRKCYSKNIYPFGLPFNEKKISQMQPKDQILKMYNINPGRQNILFFGGGSNGVMTYLKYLKKMLKMHLNYNIIFVCGKSQKLYNEAKRLEKKYPNLVTLGFINNVYELMEVSQMVISKPGGATVTECLEMQKFMLLLPGIGGQEKHNAKFVFKNGYGVYVTSKYLFKKFLLKYNMNPQKFHASFNHKKRENESLKQIENLIDKL